MTDIITNGRLDIGIARGAYSFEYERMVPGMDAWSAGQRLREMIPAIKTFGKAIMSIMGNFGSFQNHLSTSTASTTASTNLGCCRDQIATNLLCKMAVMYR